MASSSAGKGLRHRKRVSALPERNADQDSPHASLGRGIIWQLFMLVGVILLCSVCALNAALLLGRMQGHGSIPLADAQPDWTRLFVDMDSSAVVSNVNAKWTVLDIEYGLSWDIFLIDRHTGQVHQLTKHFASDRFPVLSPDDRQVAFVSWRDGNAEVYVLDLANGALRNISTHPAMDILPVWSPSGSVLSFSSNRDGNSEIYLADVKRGLVLNLTKNPLHDSQPTWLAAANSLTFVFYRDGRQQQYGVR
jgi:WD40 repeat protein